MTKMPQQKMTEMSQRKKQSHIYRIQKSQQYCKKKQ